MRLNKKKREEVQINNMRNKEGTSTDATENKGGTVSILFKNKSGFSVGAVVENLPANAGDTGSSPGLGRSHMPRSN